MNIWSHLNNLGYFGLNSFWEYGPGIKFTTYLESMKDDSCILNRNHLFYLALMICFPQQQNMPETICRFWPKFLLRIRTRYQIYHIFRKHERWLLHFKQEPFILFGLNDLFSSATEHAWNHLQILLTLNHEQKHLSVTLNHSCNKERLLPRVQLGGNAIGSVCMPHLSKQHDVRLHSPMCTPIGTP